MNHPPLKETIDERRGERLPGPSPPPPSRLNGERHCQFRSFPTRCPPPRPHNATSWPTCAAAGRTGHAVPAIWSAPLLVVGGDRLRYTANAGLALRDFPALANPAASESIMRPLAGVVPRVV